MDPAAFAEMRKRLEDLLVERLDAQGKTLSAQAYSARKRLPRRVRRDLAFLISVAPRMDNPKLAHKIDSARVSAAAGRARGFLESVAPGKYRKRARSALIARIAFQILILLLLGGALLRWRGFI